MSNLFTLKARLSALQSEEKLSLAQQAFIAQFLTDITSQLTQSPTQDTFITLKKTIGNEIQKYPNSSYRRALSQILANIKSLQKRQASIAAHEQKQTKAFKAYAFKMDAIFLITHYVYHGSLLLPVSQRWDWRLGDSKGECFGFVAQWATQLLKGQRPFGISMNNPPPFHPISYHSRLGRKHPELNHLAMLKEDISTYQRLQKSPIELAKKISGKLGLHRKETIHFKKKRRRFYSSVDDLAKKLIHEANKEIDAISHLSISNYNSGHALGFCNQNGKYHFFDSNSGWFYFEKASDFERWLPFYFRWMKYDRKFPRYAINTYQLNKNVAKEKTPDSLAAKIIGSIIFGIVVLPMLLIMIAIKIIERLAESISRWALRRQLKAYRSLKEKERPYIIQTMKQDMKTFCDTVITEETETPLPLSLRPLDLAITAKIKPSPVAKMAHLLDVPLHTVRKAQLNAAQNPLFKRSIFSLTTQPSNGNPKEAEVLPTCGRA